MNSDTHLQDRCARLEHQISALKTVSGLRKNLLGLRERQAKDLISKLKFYEVLVAGERESRHNLSSRLESAELTCAQLTEKLKDNIHTIDEIKANYENKVSTLINELQISEQRNQQLSDQLNCAQLRISEATKDFTMEELSRKLEEKEKFLKEMQKQLKRVWDRNKVLSYQMSLLNTLFNETEGVTIDFEKIKAIGDIVRESQTLAEETDEDMLGGDEDPNSHRRPSVDLENLLDSMEKSENVMPEEIPGEESCYKSVDTKRGPQLVLSVSRTFIKLKDLIVEKKSLQKEIDTLKSLNNKLESKVDKQEHRLYRVTMELNKTWSLVSKLKQQHKRLYNSEAVLRYELQEKRALLEKLKNELSASREKWRRVRQKNSQSQIEWEKLRDEFALRKHQSSQESGTFSEVMSVSSGDNDVTLEEVDEKASVRCRSNSKQLERPKTLPIPIDTALDPPSNDGPPDIDGNDDFEDGPAEEEEYEEGACALSPVDDALDSEDPLEELVSALVEDIDNEADTEEESGSRTESQLENNESSPSPDFEDRMRRRANRLRMLEEQCLLLHQKLVASTERSVTLSSKLAQLHDHYGPSGSSTGTPSDEHHNEPSEIHEEIVTETCMHATEDETSTSTDAAYVSGTENNSSSEAFEPKSCTQVISENVTEPNRPETTASREVELINASQNSNSEILPSPTENNVPINDAQQQTQGHLNAEFSPSSSSSTHSSETTTTLSHTDTEERVLMPANTSDFDASESPSIMHNMPPVQVSISVTTPDSENNRDDRLTTGITQPELSQASLPEPLDVAATPSPNQQQEPSSSSSHVQQASPPELEETLPIQETVVQHFPSTTEEEANEFGSVQIRPEFLRILQEADEATNAYSLDWMPSLLTITHNVALLRLDPELPPSPNTNDSSTNNPRPVSESLRIEIPRLSPIPPPAVRQNPNRSNCNSQASNRNDDESSVEEGSDNRFSDYRKDPSFLSRVIIQQLPKRLQLLKNENHTLQMENVEAKMRTKEMQRKLSKELERTHLLAVNLDSQIEDKNLIEFELREELEKKEKVIEELQMEIDESKEYVDELKKEKDEVESLYKMLLEEKMDMDQPKAAPESAKNCENCKRMFTLITRRKYHCKICGKVFCKDCALQREPYKRSLKRPRLCTRCHLRRQRLGVLAKQKSEENLN